MDRLWFLWGKALKQFKGSVFLPAFAMVGSLVVVELSTTPAVARSMKSEVQQAIKTHPSGLAQIANQRAIANELDASRSRYLPEVELFGDIGAEIVDNPSSLSATDNADWKATRQIGLSARLTLFDGYERANAMYRNAARLDGALYSTLATSEAVALNAVEAYIDVHRHRRLLTIARRNIERHREILRQIKSRVAGGKSPASDSFQIEERVFAARTVEVEIEKASLDAAAKFRKAIGRSPKGKMSIPQVRSLPRSLAALINNSLNNSYELKSLRKAVSENEYATNAGDAAYLPKLFLEGRTTIGADRGGSKGNEQDAFVGLKLSWKLFDGGVASSETTAQAERTGQAMYLRDVKVLEIRETAERSWNSHVKDGRRRSLLQSQVNTNRKIVKNYREEYELAKRTLLDVLDAERARFNSEFQQIGAAAAHQFSSFRMLATQNRLAEHFGMPRDKIVPDGDYENKFLDASRRGLVNTSGQSIFNIDIAPLR